MAGAQVEQAEDFKSFLFPGDGRVGAVEALGDVTKYQLGFDVFGDLDAHLAPGEFGLGDVSVLMHFPLASRPKMYAQVVCLDRIKETPHNQHVERLVQRDVWGPCLLVFLHHVGDPVNAFEGAEEDDLVFHEEPLTLGAVVARLEREHAAAGTASAQAESQSAFYLLERAREWDREHTPLERRAEQALREMHRGAHFCMG